MKKVITWVSGVFKDEKGTPSSKRMMGVLCALTLCVTMWQNSFSDVQTAPSTALVDAVALLAFGCLGLTSVDKFVKAKEDKKKAESMDDPEV